MRYRITEFDGLPLIEVRLSRRNLLALLTKLDTAGSAGTMVHIGADTDDNGLEDSTYVLVVKAEDDADHYSDRGFAGTMHPATEAYLQRVAQDRN